jgi:hypothetical protein
LPPTCVCRLLSGAVTPGAVHRHDPVGRFSRRNAPAAGAGTDWRGRADRNAVEPRDAHRGLLDWAGKTNMSGEQSPGGSRILRYLSSHWAPPKAGLPAESAIRFAAAREKVYRELFGETQGVSREAIPLVPSIGVHTYLRSGSRGNVFALVTSGMSDLPLRVPPGAGSDAPRRVELIFYCAEPKSEYIETLRWVARFPHDQKTWLSFGHTLPNGNPPAPFWGSEILDTLLFMPTILKRDAGLAEALVLDGDPVHFLWVVPLSTPECNLKLDQGYDAILGLFEKNRHPHVFDPARKSYV